MTPLDRFEQNGFAEFVIPSLISRLIGKPAPIANPTFNSNYLASGRIRFIPTSMPNMRETGDFNSSGQCA
jgi:hypothetical protein